MLQRALGERCLFDIASARVSWGPHAIGVGGAEPGAERL
jgi:hypothetical protein